MSVEKKVDDEDFLCAHNFFLSVMTSQSLLKSASFFYIELILINSFSREARTFSKSWAQRRLAKEVYFKKKNVRYLLDLLKADHLRLLPRPPCCCWSFLAQTKTLKAIWRKLYENMLCNDIIKNKEMKFQRIFKVVMLPTRRHDLEYGIVRRMYCRVSSKIESGNEQLFYCWYFFNEKEKYLN